MVFEEFLRIKLSSGVLLLPNNLTVFDFFGHAQRVELGLAFLVSDDAVGHVDLLELVVLAAIHENSIIHRDKRSLSVFSLFFMKTCLI